MKEKQKLGEILVNRRLITSEQLKEALEIQSEIEDSYVQALFIDRDIINVKNIKKAQEESKKQNKKLQEVILEMKLASVRDVEEVFSLIRKSPFIFLSEHRAEIGTR